MIVARIREKAGDFDGGSNGNDAGVGGEGARWLLGGASVGSAVRDCAGLLFVYLVVWRLGIELHWDLSWLHW